MLPERLRWWLSGEIFRFAKPVPNAQAVRTPMEHSNDIVKLGTKVNLKDFDPSDHEAEK